MKKIFDVKNYIDLYFKKLTREQIAIFICIPLALVALSVCAIMLLKADKKSYEIPSDAIYVTESATEKRTYPPDSPYGIEFESFDNGSCAIVGIGSFTEKNLKIPQKSPYGEVVTEIKSTAFKNCDNLESITIPSTVQKIEEGAFKGCSSLIYIDVAMDNEYFTSISGVLFSKNKTRLIYYPANRAGDKYYLNPNVKTISDYAFEDAKNISAIFYPNNTSDFESISIGKGNDILHTLPITCNYSGEVGGK